MQTASFCRQHWLLSAQAESFGRHSTQVPLKHSPAQHSDDPPHALPVPEHAPQTPATH
jgi:hypothetical protein